MAGVREVADEATDADHAIKGVVPGTCRRRFARRRGLVRQWGESDP